MFASEKGYSVFNNSTNSSQCINSTVTLVVTNLHKVVQPTPTPSLFETRQLAAAESTFTFVAVEKGAEQPPNPVEGGAFALFSTMASIGIVGLALVF